MKKSKSGLIVFCIGGVLMALAEVSGKLLVPGIKELGIEGYWRTHGIVGVIKIMIWFLGFPLGSMISVIGALLLSSASKARVWIFVIAAVLAVLIPRLTPIVFGTGTSPAFFGIGGSLILVIFVATAWYWGVNREGLTERAKAAADLQMIGYVSFVIAAWMTCGLGGIPAFTLYPEKMQAFNSLPIAVRLMKNTMVFFVLGWFFTLLSIYKKSRIIKSQARTESTG